MEAAAAARDAALPVSPAQASRKEWRVVTEQTVRNASGEEMERMKLGQSDERLIYEQGREPVDVDFCSIPIQANSDNVILQQRLHSVVKQREELQQMEIALRTQLIARSEVMELRNSFDAQIKEHANSNAKLQEQMRDRDQKIYELERMMDEKERELHAIRLDNEAAWAKEDLLREQSKELQTYRRERDNSEAERAQHIKQIHEFQEHIQEKERQFLELQEQSRVAQETILFKDEQIREAQAWITRVQEVDALQQADLRERTEQYNQLWLCSQRQFGEMERLHMHLQQLQRELVEARGGAQSDGSQVSISTSKDATYFGQNNGSQLNVSGNITAAGNPINLPNGSAENASSGNVSTQSEHVHGVPVAPSSLLGMTTYLPPGHIPALHPYVMHQQGVPPSVPSHVPQSHVGHFQSVPAISSLQHWPNQQVVAEGAQMSGHNPYSLQVGSTLPKSDSNYDYVTTVNENTLHPEYVDVNMGRGVEPQDHVVPASTEGQVEAPQPMDKNYISSVQSQQTLQQISSQFSDALRLDSLEHKNEEVKHATSLTNHRLDSQGLTISGKNVDTLSSEVPNHTTNSAESVTGSTSSVVLPETFVGQKNAYVVGTAAEINLLDERTLLACIVRTIPPGSSGRIKISTTLPNRLGKMLAPLHWHDYKKKYGKLDEFVASHPELFIIDGDYIQLREGAQEIIAATAAAAKVAAAAAAQSYPSLLPAVAVTPMAQSHRLKRTPANSGDNLPQFTAMQSQHSNGVVHNTAGGVSNVKFLTKPRTASSSSSRR